MKMQIYVGHSELKATGESQSLKVDYLKTLFIAEELIMGRCTGRSVEWDLRYAMFWNFLPEKGNSEEICSALYVLSLFKFVLFGCECFERMTAAGQGSYSTR